MSHRTKVASLVSDGINGQRNTQLKSVQMSEKVTQEYNEAFQAIGVTHLI